MLALSRKPGEAIKIGGDVTLVIVSVKGDTVTVGIEAPREVKILRGELENREQGE